MKHNIKTVDNQEVHEIYDFVIDKYLPESWFYSDFATQVKLLSKALPDEVVDYIYMCDVGSVLELEFYVHGANNEYSVQVIDVVDFLK